MRKDIEISIISGILSSFQHVVQPGVIAVISHVVGNDVLQPRHAMRLKSRRQLLQLLFRAYFRAQDQRVRYIITVRTAFECGSDRRSIDSGYSQLMQVTDDTGKVPESEMIIQLYTI